MPMMSIETVKKAQSLIAQRAWIVEAKWDYVVEKYTCLVPGGHTVNHLEPADEQLQSAIEEGLCASSRRRLAVPPAQARCDQRPAARTRR
jgi:hypothetical protein